MIEANSLTGWLLLSLLVAAGSASARGLPSNLDELTPEDLRQSAIAFISASTSPGLEGAEIDVEQSRRDSHYLRGGASFAADVTLKGSAVDFHWGGGLVGADLNEQLDFLHADSRALALQLDRKVRALRGSVGVTVPVSVSTRMRAYYTATYSQLNTRFQLYYLDNPLALEQDRTSAEAFTSSMTLEYDYSRFAGPGRWELLAKYSGSYTETLSDDSPYLRGWAWGQLFTSRAQLVMDTQKMFLNRPWQWRIYGGYTDFLDQSKLALGYSKLGEVGVGLGWKINIKPLDWFGWRYAGLRFGYIFGDDLRGVNIGFSAQ